MLRALLRSTVVHCAIRVGDVVLTLLFAKLLITVSISELNKFDRCIRWNVEACRFSFGMIKPLCFVMLCSMPVSSVVGGGVGIICNGHFVPFGFRYRAIRLPIRFGQCVDEQLDFSFGKLFVSVIDNTVLKSGKAFLLYKHLIRVSNGYNIIFNETITGARRCNSHKTQPTRSKIQ